MPRASRTKLSPADETAKQAQLADLRRQVYARQRDIIESQIRSAIGLVHFFVRDPHSGKFERSVDTDEMQRMMNDPACREGTHYMLSAKDPNNAAAALVLAYALDQPKKPPEDHHMEGTLEVSWKGQRPKK